MHFHLFAASASLKPVLLAVFVMCGIAGVVALVSPRRFSTLARGSNRWIDTKRVLESLDRRVDIDHFVLPYTRVLGAAVLVSIAVMAVVFRRFL